MSVCYVIVPFFITGSRKLEGSELGEQNSELGKHTIRFLEPQAAVLVIAWFEH